MVPVFYFVRRNQSWSWAVSCFSNIFGYFVTLKGKDLSISLSPFIWLKPKDISLEAFNDSFVPNGVFSELNWNLTRKVFVLGLFHTECWRLEMCPIPLHLEHIISNKISFWSRLVTPLPRLVLSMDCDWIIRKCLASLEIRRESSRSLHYQTFVGTLQGNLYFNLEVFDDLLCVCAFSDFDWPLATCRNKLNAIAARIYK